MKLFKAIFENKHLLSRINALGEKFTKKNNNKKFAIIFNNMVIYNLKYPSEIDLNNLNNKSKFKLKLVSFLDIYDFSHMFNNSNLLSSFSVSNIRRKFVYSNGAVYTENPSKPLLYFKFKDPEQKKNGKMNKMIEASLNYIYDFTSEKKLIVNKINHMFFGCKSLKSLPDFSNWDLSSITDLSYLFSGCESLKSIPDATFSSMKNEIIIYHYYSSNLRYMNHLFYGCTSLESIPDITNLDTSKVIDMSYMFYQCLSLTSFPDISKWDFSKVRSMSHMYDGCVKLKSIPNIDKWNIPNVEDISYMFYGCLSLSPLPNLSIFNSNKINNKEHIIDGCQSSILSKYITNFSKWKYYNNLRYKYLLIKFCEILNKFMDSNNLKNQIIQLYNSLKSYFSLYNMYKLVYKKEIDKDSVKILDEIFVKNNEDKCILVGQKKIFELNQSMKVKKILMNIQ